MWESCTLAFPCAVNRVIHDSIACYAHFHNACLLVFSFFWFGIVWCWRSISCFRLLASLPYMSISDGDVTQSISLEKQLNIIQVADLVLPDKETSFEEYTTMELLSVAMLIVISTFALDFIHTDRSVFKIVDLDEAWSFLQVAQGKTLSMKLVRAGRAMNAGVYFVTQNTDDLLDEKLKNNLGLKFAFRSTDINEIKKTLAFFGVDSEDENNQKRLRDLENGQCLISDLYGRVGVIQFHPIFEDLFHAFDTRPPVRKEVE